MDVGKVYMDFENVRSAVGEVVKVCFAVGRFAVPPFL